MHFITTEIGRLRLLGALEGISALLLFFVAMPIKYILGNPSYVRIIGSVHGGLFILFVVAAFMAASTYNWKFKDITWKLLLGSIIPFGTFYVDHKILSKLESK